MDIDNPKVATHRLYAWKILGALGCDVSDADLRDADLRDANLSDANLSGAYLSGADLSGAYLSGANLRRAKLSRANLSDADLRGAYLSGAYLSGANLSGVRNIFRISGHNGSSEGRDLIANMREVDGEWYCHIYAGCWGANGINGSGGTLDQFRERVNDVYGVHHEYHDDIARLVLWEQRRKSEVE